MTDKEAKRLEKTTSKKMCIFMHSGMLILVLITLWSGGFKIYAAHQLATLEGVTLEQLFSDVDFHDQFSGVYVTASKWLIEGVFRIIPVTLFITLWALLSVLIRRNKQILALGKGSPP